MGFDLIARSPSSNRRKPPNSKDRLIKDAAANGGFATIPNALLKPSCLRPNERLIFIVLLSWTRPTQVDEEGRRFCSVSIAKLEEGSGLHRATVKRALAGLVLKGIIRRSRQKTGASLTLVTWAHSAPTPSEVGAHSAHLGALCALPGCSLRPTWDHQRSHLEEEEELEEDLKKKIEPIQIYSEILKALSSHLRGQVKKATREISIDGALITFHAVSLSDRDFLVDHCFAEISRAVHQTQQQHPRTFPALRWRSV
jgi:DNA-binding MarR family transcriptional regulator